MIKKRVTIINKLGLHARAAAKFVNVASHYAATITVRKGNQAVNGKSIMGVMMLAAAKGSELEIECAGEDETEQLAAIDSLIRERFAEEA